MDVKIKTIFTYDVVADPAFDINSIRIINRDYRKERKEKYKKLFSNEDKY